MNNQRKTTIAFFSLQCVLLVVLNGPIYHVVVCGARGTTHGRTRGKEEPPTVSLSSGN